LTTSGAKLRIVLVSQFALPKICGIAAIVDQVARKLVERGHDVTHVASSWGRGESPAAVPYRLVTLPVWNPLEPRLGVPYPMFPPRALWRELRELIESADVFHTHGFLSQTSSAGLFMTRRRRTAGVLTEHVGHVPYANPLIDTVESLAIATFGRVTARMADAIVTYNATVEATMRRIAPDVRFAHIENGVDTVRYRPPADDERARLRAELGWDEHPHVLFVGRLVDKKGAPIAIEAARLAGGAFRLVLVGPGAPPPAHPDVIWLGAMSQERVAEIYRAADAFVLPSTGEGFPLSAQEALASGLPVVLSDEPAYHPILEGAGETVILAKRDARSFADAVQRAIALPPPVRAAATAFARGRFSWDASAEQLLELYHSLCA